MDNLLWKVTSYSSRVRAVDSGVTPELVGP